MTSYFRNWLSTGALAAPPPPSITFEDEDDEDDEDDDVAPAFPALNSAQRLNSGIPSILTDTDRMPPPPPPSPAVRQPGVPLQPTSFLSPSSLSVPPTTTKRPATRKREKVALAPGHSSLDWADLKASGEDLRGVDTLLRIPPSVLKLHNKRDDAWAAFNGKVYNITPYLSFHPGGEKELMRVAGRDGTKLFANTHAWVNVDFMMDACLVGFLVSEPSSSSS